MASDYELTTEVKAAVKWLLSGVNLVEISAATVTVLHDSRDGYDIRRIGDFPVKGKAIADFIRNPENGWSHVRGFYGMNTARYERITE